MHEPIQTREMTRTEFEERFGVVLPAEAIGVTLYNPYTGLTIHINFYGHRHFEIQELEKLYRLQGDQ